jgi:16S rRNA pseudouridine516 synthase
VSVLQRLDKFLADQNIGTRKQIREYIKNGTVTVNGITASRADMHIDVSADAVTFMGRKLEYEQYHYYMLNKPDGVVSATRDGRSVTVINLLKGENVRNLSPVGRLDKDTEDC